MSKAISNIVGMPSRRKALAIAAGAAAVAAVPAGAVCLVAEGNDAIYTVIERHRSAWFALSREIPKTDELEQRIPREQRRSFFKDDPDLETDHPDWTASRHDLWRAMDDCERAALALTEIRPTTIAGVMALLSYVEAFNRGELHISDNSRSEHYQWPEDLIDDDFVGVADRSGEPVMLPWPYWVMRNIRLALADMTAQA